MDDKVSLVIPVKNEARSLEVLLKSISAQTALPDEVIFVDAGSTDSTRDMISAYTDRMPNIKLISIGPAYPGVARNAGARESRNDIIAFTDGGIELDKDWLSELSLSMSGDKLADIVYGNYAPRTDTFFKQCISMAVVPPPKVVGEATMRPRFIASSIMRKRVWRAIGGFPDLRAAEDRIFMERIDKNGYRSAYNPRANVVWDVPGDLRGVFRRFSNYSYHDLLAGRTKDWHKPVLKMYMAVLLFICMGLSVSPYFYLLPAAGLIARAARKVAINRNEPYFKPGDFPQYAALTGFLIFFVDVAMFAGWARYLISKKPDIAKSTGRV